MIAIDAGQTIIDVTSGLSHAAVLAVAERELGDAVAGAQPMPTRATLQC